MYSTPRFSNIARATPSSASASTQWQCDTNAPGPLASKRSLANGLGTNWVPAIYPSPRNLPHPHPSRYRKFSGSDRPARLRFFAINPKRPNKLLLWDIDGTLVSAGRAGEFALEDSIRATCGAVPDLDGIEIAGRTDRAIAAAVLSKYAMPPSLENIARFLDGYIEALARRLPERRPFGKVLAGIVEILDEVQRRPDLAQGLLTGNIRRGAQLKLEHYNVFHYFAFGAFADDHHDRNALPPFAKSRAEARFDVLFPPDRIFVIGDTPHDIACGKAIGAHTIGVATGRFSADELRACGANLAVADLSDKAAFFAFIDRA